MFRRQPKQNSDDEDAEAFGLQSALPVAEGDKEMEHPFSPTDPPIDGLDFLRRVRSKVLVMFEFFM